MDNNKNKIIVIAVICITIITGLFMILFREEKSVEERSYEPKEVIAQEFLEARPGYININGYTSIENVFIDNSQLYVSGENTYVESMNQKIDLNTLEYSTVSSSSPLKQKTSGIIKRLGKNDYLLLDSNTLYYVTGEEKKVVEDELNLDNGLQLKVSDDHSKLIYFDNGEKFIETYNISTGRVRQIRTGITLENLKEFDERVYISPKGGYFLVSLPDENFRESFSVYGSDSGYCYAKDIMGIKPKFSTDDKRVSFLYAGEYEEVSNNIVKTTIGILNLSNKKIDYINDVKEKEVIFNNIAFTDDSSLVYFGGESSENGTKINKIVRYNYDSKLKELASKEIIDQIPYNSEMQIIDNQLLLTTEDKLVIIDLNNFTSVSTNKYQPYQNNNKRINCLVVNNGILYSYKDQIIYKNASYEKVVYSGILENMKTFIDDKATYLIVVDQNNQIVAIHL